MYCYAATRRASHARAQEPTGDTGRVRDTDRAHRSRLGPFAYQYVGEYGLEGADLLGPVLLAGQHALDVVQIDLLVQLELLQLGRQPRRLGGHGGRRARRRYTRAEAVSRARRKRLRVFFFPEGEEKSFRLGNATRVLGRVVCSPDDGDGGPLLSRARARGPNVITSSNR